MKLRGLVSNLRIHVSVSDLYVPTIGPPILLQQNKETDLRNISITHGYMNAGIGNKVPRNHFLEYLFRIFSPASLQCAFACFEYDENKKETKNFHVDPQPLVKQTSSRKFEVK
jgi:hypothetical protein